MRDSASAQTQLVEYALRLVDRLGDVLNEEDSVGQNGVKRCRHQIGYHSEISADKRRHGRALTVERRWWNRIELRLAGQYFKQRLRIVVAPLQRGQMLGHGCMD